MSESSLVGLYKEQVDTPALLLDLDRFERNVTRLSGALKDAGVAWRPHSKAHKSPYIAARQVGMGAIGVTCAKVSEAEVMVEHDITSVLIANELPSKSKYERVARLQKRAEVFACADAEEHVQLAAAAGVAAGVDVPLLVEVDPGMHRVGIAPGVPARDLAVLIEKTRGVRFAGVMGYEGHVLTLWPASEKEAAARAAMAGLIETRDLIEKSGIPVGIVSAGGSGSYMFSSRVDGITEIQAGGACFMDVFYSEECHLAGEGYEFALTVLAAVTSRPAPDRAIVDAGFKTLSKGIGSPRPVGMDEGVGVRYLSAEHGCLGLGPGAPELRIGDRIEFIPDYSDTTTYHHDQFLGMRGGRVERVIPLLARGQLT